jgi:CTP synthase (UTP-ammonia lyase)
VGCALELRFTPGSRVAGIFGGLRATEQYYCNFGVNPERAAVLESGPLRVVGRDDEGEVRVVEAPDHPFFVGTLFLPQARSTEEQPHPLVTAFVRAALEYQARLERL